MTTLTDRIAEVLAAYPKASEHHCGSPDCVGDSGYHCWANYVAHQIVEDLHLSEEIAVSPPYSTEARIRPGKDLTAYKSWIWWHRWLSDWIPVEEKS